MLDLSGTILEYSNATSECSMWFRPCCHHCVVLYFQSEALDKRFDINLHDIGELGYEVIIKLRYYGINKIKHHCSRLTDFALAFSTYDT